MFLNYTILIIFAFLFTFKSVQLWAINYMVTLLNFSCILAIQTAGDWLSTPNCFSKSLLMQILLYGMVPYPLPCHLYLLSKFNLHSTTFHN